MRTPAYFTPRRDVAESFASDEANVIEAELDDDAILIDLDMPGGLLLTPDEASSYLGEEGMTVQDFVDRGYSIGVEDHNSIRSIVRDERPMPADPAKHSGSDSHARSPMATSRRSNPKILTAQDVFKDETRRDMRAFHGSPHQFDRFSMDHIGSGEGAQAYGWGLYFAGDEAVARWHRGALAPPIPDEWGDRSVARESKAAKIAALKAASNMRETVNQAIRKALRASSGFVSPVAL